MEFSIFPYAWNFMENSLEFPANPKYIFTGLLQTSEELKFRLDE